MYIFINLYTIQIVDSLDFMEVIGNDVERSSDLRSTAWPVSRRSIKHWSRKLEDGGSRPAID